LEYIFDANVGDHAPDVKVNKGIQTTLSNPGGDDFWWLNNGVTAPNSREFEVVIMVERAIGEMFGSDRNSAPIDYMRAFVIDDE
jgi:hypothetical protein